MENTHAGTDDESGSTEPAQDESDADSIEDIESEGPSIEEVFSTDEDERIEAALDFVEDENNPSTLGGLLEWVRDEDGSDLAESKLRERARERGLIESPDE